MTGKMLTFKLLLEGNLCDNFRPEGIWECGNKEQLLRFKPYFREDMENGKMGSGPCWDLLMTLRPNHWYSAHLHCRFDANVQHSETERTKFVALDKCLPNRKFLDFLDIGQDNTNPPEIKYDLQWLTVLHLTNNLLNVSRNYTKLPLQPGPDDPQDNVQRYEFTPSAEEMDAVLKKFNGDLTIPKNFVRSQAAYNPQRDGRNFRNLNPQIIVELNPQTTNFCERLGLDDSLFLAAKFSKIDLTTSVVNITQSAEKETEKIPVVVRAPLASFLPQPKFTNDEEIDLDELENNEKDEQKEEPEKTISETSSEKTAAVKEPLVEAEPADVAPTPSKKFKRRNQDIYTATDDE
jgi:lariat debranching enzyme